MTNSTQTKVALKNHTTKETGYKAQMPWGFRERADTVFWIEDGGKMGFRFCTVTTNPKTGRECAVKKSTYALIAMGMYLDENGHVKYDQISEYSDHGVIAEYVKVHGTTPRIQSWVTRKAAFQATWAKRGVFTVNGVPQPVSDAERARREQEAAAWHSLLSLVDCLRGISCRQVEA